MKDSGLARVGRWMPTPRTLAIAAASVLVVLVGAGGLWYWSAVSEQRATAAYGAALARAQAARSPEATAETRARATRELELALQTHPSARLTGEAAYELGALRFGERQFEAARRAYEIARTRAASPTVRTLARLDIAATWEAEKNAAKAADVLQSLLGDLKPTDAFFEQALIDLGRAQELAGRKDDAVATYRRALKDPARGVRADEIRIRLASLGATP